MTNSIGKPNKIKIEYINGEKYVKKIIKLNNKLKDSANDIFSYINQYVNQIINKIKVKLQNQKNKLININNNFNSNDLLKIYQEVQLERLKIILNIKGSDIKLPNKIKSILISDLPKHKSEYWQIKFFRIFIIRLN